MKLGKRGAAREARGQWRKEKKRQDQKLSEEEILVNCVGLFAGGHETTTNLIGNGLLALLLHPEAANTLREDSSLIGSAIEELLRYDSPVSF